MLSNIVFYYTLHDYKALVVAIRAKPHILRDPNRPRKEAPSQKALGPWFLLGFTCTRQMQMMVALFFADVNDPQKEAP